MGRCYARPVQSAWIPQIPIRSLSHPIHLNAADEGVNLNYCSLQIPPWTRGMCRCLSAFLVNVALQYQQQKQGFWIECTVSTWRLKFLALVNSVPQIVHGKRSGLLECCCRTCHSISCLYAKVNGQNRHCTRCSVVPHLFLCWKKWLLLKCFPQVGQGLGYVTFGMIIRVTSNKYEQVLSESTCFVIAMTSIPFPWERACLGKSKLWHHCLLSSWISVITNLNSIHGFCICAINHR